MSSSNLDYQPGIPDQLPRLARTQNEVRRILKAVNDIAMLAPSKLPTLRVVIEGIRDAEID